MRKGVGVGEWGAEMDAFFVIAKSGASSISVIHQAELITSESGVS